MPFSLLFPLHFSERCPNEEVFLKHQLGSFTPHTAVCSFFLRSWANKVVWKSGHFTIFRRFQRPWCRKWKCQCGIIALALTPVFWLPLIHNRFLKKTKDVSNQPSRWRSRQPPEEKTQLPWLEKGEGPLAQGMRLPWWQNRLLKKAQGSDRPQQIGTS